jgi:type IV secretion system protein VirB3/type IV secretion system protein VirB4
MGAEREPVMTAALIALLVGVGGLTAVSLIAALVFWLAAVFALRRMAKADPIMSRVWLRHIKQQDFYPAKVSRWRLIGGYPC